MICNVPFAEAKHVLADDSPTVAKAFRFVPLKQSQLELTSSIARDFTDWRCASIRERQQRLADLGPATWPLN
jgi:hypothetical protein